MKLWLAILLTIVVIGTYLLVAPEEVLKPIVSMTGVLTAVWVYNNAKKIEIEKYKSNLSMSPLAIAIWTFFLWPIFFPAYLGLNWRIKNGKQPMKDSQPKIS